MRKRVDHYCIINIVILLITFILIWKTIYPKIFLTLWSEKVLSVGIVFVLMIIVYMIKAMRLYLIMLECRIPTRRYIRLYIKTTLVNLGIPYKMGEIFKIYCYGREIQDNKTAFVCLLIDRFFDTVPLLTLLLCFTAVSSKMVLPVVAMLSLFLALVFIGYNIFPSTFCYINKFLIMNANSERGIKALFYLNKLKIWYGFASRLIQGRSMVLLILSTVTWMMEYGILCCLAWGIGGYFSSGNFVDYMNSVFVSGNNIYADLYVGYSALLLLLSALMIYGSFVYKWGKSV